MAVRKRRDEDEPGLLHNVIEAPITPRQLTVSETLRNRRIECGLDIAHVADVLRIRPTVLTAIEDGNFDLLPGPAYAIGFVRSYATYLGIDAEALVLRFKAEAAEVSNRPHLHFPLPIHDSRVPTGPLLVICVLLAMLTYAGWYYFNAPPDRVAGIVPSVPDRLHHLLDPPRSLSPPTITAPQTATPPASPAGAAEAPATAAQASQPAASPPNSALAGAGAASPATVAANPGPAAVDGVPPVENRDVPAAPTTPQAGPDLAQPAAVAVNPAAPAPTTSFGAPEGQSRVVLRASADSWVQVRDKASNLLFTRVLKPGEHYNVPNVPGLTLVAGNAGGLDVTVDGVNAPRIGELGHVARNVSLDPDHLLTPQPHAN
jgi:cytoskeleton protein RodZ